MRLTSITLRDYRGVTASTVAFSSGITVVEGPNEIGKSSLAEALRLIRSTKATSTSKEIKALKPVDRDAGPEVELALSTGDYQLTYRKRWLKQPLTELRILQPVPEQLSGDEAHNRFEEILRATVDPDLLTAMTVLQGQSLDQAELAPLPALRRALDDSSAEQDDHDQLMTRIETEYARFFTGTGRASGDYRRLQDQVAALTATLQDCQEASHKLDDLTADHERTAQTCTRLATELAAAQHDLTGLKARAEELDTLQQAVEQADQRSIEAEKLVQLAEARQDARASRVAAVGVREREVAERADRVATAATELEVAQAQQDLCAGAVETARTASQSAAELSRAATRTVQQVRDQRELGTLSDQLESARAARTRLQQASAVLTGIGVDALALDLLTELDREVQVARRVRESAAARITVRPLGGHPVTVDGVQLGEGAQHTRQVLDVVHIEVPGVVSVQVEPGATPSELIDRLTTAGETLEAELARLGVSSIEQARVVAEEQRRAQAEHDQAEQTLQVLLQKTTIEALEERLAELRHKVSDQAAEPTADDPALLEARADQAAGAQRLADQQLDQARDQAEASRRALDATRERWLREDEGLKAARLELEREAALLVTERAGCADATLDQQVAEARAEQSACQQAARDARTPLLAAEPEALGMQLANAQDLVHTKEADLSACRDKLIGLRALLDQALGEGRYDRVARAEAELEAAQVDWQRMQRAAAAVSLLRSTMLRHRSGARSRYLAPFKEGIERLGRIIFEPDFTVQLTPELTIESRTLAGRTVPFGSLSAGAREQLSLLGRLACAQLVDSAEGAPVILDDTLGFADPRRLKALNIVLNDVGRHAQVVLLTCQPQRFANVGGASVVRLGM